jgi:acylphosphatase
VKVRAHIYVSGRVQGVGYRAFVMRIAETYGLDGWVRNLPDYSVEAVFEGEKHLIEAAVKRCQEGPPSAYVSSVDINWTDIPEDIKTFSVRY